MGGGGICVLKHRGFTTVLAVAKWNQAACNTFIHNNSLQSISFFPQHPARQQNKKRFYSNYLLTLRAYVTHVIPWLWVYLIPDQLYVTDSRHNNIIFWLVFDSSRPSRADWVKISASPLTTMRTTTISGMTETKYFKQNFTLTNSNVIMGHCSDSLTTYQHICPCVLLVNVSSCTQSRSPIKSTEPYVLITSESPLGPKSRPSSYTITHKEG